MILKLIIDIQSHNLFNVWKILLQMCGFILNYNLRLEATLWITLKLYNIYSTIVCWILSSQRSAGEYAAGVEKLWNETSVSDHQDFWNFWGLQFWGDEFITYFVYKLHGSGKHFVMRFTTFGFVLPHVDLKLFCHFCLSAIGPPFEHTCSFLPE